MSDNDFADEFGDMDEGMGDNGPLPADGPVQADAGTETVDGVTIDYTVPIPQQSAAGGGPKPKWPWHAVRVGGSIKFTDPRVANSAVSSAKRWAKRNPNEDGTLPQFVRRATGTKDNPEFRVFRTQ